MSWRPQCLSSLRRYFSFQWHITNACDQRCQHCYIYADPAVDAAAEAAWNEIEKVFGNILEFSHRFGRIPYLYLTGGDPLLHPDFWRLAEKLQQEDLPYAILGNPFHLTEEVCGRLRATGCDKYQLSLDGLEETHDSLRRPGSFQETIRALPLLKGAGIYTVIMATVSALNVSEIVPLMEMLAGHDVDLFAFSRFCNHGGRGGNGLTPLQYRKLLDQTYRLEQQLHEKGCAMELAFKDHLWTLYEFEEGRFKIPGNCEPGVIYGGCNCGSSHLTILPDGTVYACRRAESPVGNALTESLASIWLGENMEAYRDFQGFEKCTQCELLSWCRGCPAVAAAEEGDFYAADPQCWKDLKQSGSKEEQGSTGLEAQPIGALGAVLLSAFRNAQNAETAT